MRQGVPRGAARDRRPPVVSLTHLPASRVPDEHVTLLVEAVLAAPGLSVDTLRIRARLGRPAFDAAVAACRARGLLRQSSRQDGRTRLFPTGTSGEALAASPRRARQEDAS